MADHAPSHVQAHVHAHDHGHAHAHAPSDFGRAFAIGIALNLGFVLAETVFGFIANSMALLADAGHNLSDVLGLVVAWAGAVMARRAAALHLWPQEGADPRRARQFAAPVDRGRGHRG
jgi:cobalt-zinc-cadmium efflux system protein